MKHHTLLCWAVGAGAVLALGTAGCGTRQAAPLPAPVEVRPVAPAGPPGMWQAATGLVDLRPGPVVQFERSCARCHGVRGSLFDEGLTQMDLHGMRRAVVGMMTGPAQLRPSLGDINAMTAYILVVRDGEPFVVVDNAAAFAGGQQPSLRGEATPDTVVQIHKGGQVTPVEVRDLTWAVAKPPSPPFSVVGTRGGKQVGFAFPLRQWNEVGGKPVPPSTRNIPVPSGLP